ncbi:hypothetical protein HY639_04695 [Candidatus Woesearchaeota archaeon]|nr:hypothetical protein [Candidatus Woesearchaeota archaeon]
MSQAKSSTLWQKCVYETMSGSLYMTNLAGELLKLTSDKWVPMGNFTGIIVPHDVFVVLAQNSLQNYALGMQREYPQFGIPELVEKLEDKTLRECTMPTYLKMQPPSIVSDFIRSRDFRDIIPGEMMVAELHEGTPQAAYYVTTPVKERLR